MKLRLGTEWLDGNTSTSPNIVSVDPEFVRAWIYNAWRRVEHQPGVYDWSQPDRLMALNAGRKIIWLLNERPAWCADGDFIPRCAAFAGQVAARYGANLHAIELWNEPRTGYAPDFPDYFPGCTTWQDILAFYHRLAAAVRAAVGSLRLIGPAFYGLAFEDDLRWMAANGTLALLNGLSLHDYMMPYLPARGPATYWLDDRHLARTPAEQLKRVRDIIGQMPLYLTEVGVIDDAQRALEYAQAYLADPDVVAVIPHALMGIGDHDLHGWRGKQVRAKTAGFLWPFPEHRPAVAERELDACWGVSIRSARDIVTKHRGKVIQ